MIKIRVEIYIFIGKINEYFVTCMSQIIIIKINKMSVKSKYLAVLNLGEQLGIKDGDVVEAEGVLKIKGEAHTQYEKDLIWDKIKEIGGEHAADIKANISVGDSSVYHRHVVKSGESLSKIAKHYYGDPMKYKQIFSANTNILSNPDIIHPEQVLIIPNV